MNSPHINPGVYTLFTGKAATVVTLTDDEDFYHLEDTEAEVWKMLGQGASEKSILAQVCRRDGIPEQEAQEYLNEFFTGLEELGFVSK